MLLLLLLFLGLAVVLATLNAIRHTSAVRKRWHKTGATLGLAYTPGTQGRIGELVGDWKERRVEVTHVVQSDGTQATTEISIYLVGVAHRVGVRPEHAAAGIARMIGVRDPELGDAEFDARFHLTGDDEALLVTLGPEARQRFMRMALAPRIEDNWLVVGVAELLDKPDRIRRWLQRAVELADLLDALPPAEALYRNAVADSCWEVRRRSVELLRDLHGTSEETATVAGALASDQHPRARVLGASLLPDPAQAREVARTVAYEENAPGEARLDAVLLLEELGPTDSDHEPLWTIAQKGALDQLRISAIRTLVQLGRAQDAVRLLRASTMESPLVRAGICRAITSLGGPDALELLRAGLSDPDGDVVAAAAEGLGEIGLLEDVEPLLPLSSKRGGIGEAAEAAIQQIRQRSGVVQAQHGRLAVAEEPDADGRLSPADAKQGALSPEKVKG